MNKTRKNSAMKNHKKACEATLKSKKLKEDMKKKGINIDILKKDKNFKKTFIKECETKLKELEPLFKLLKKIRKN